MMIIKNNAVYFDGVSSKPHQTELFLDKKKNSFYFEIENLGWKNWPLTEVNFVHRAELLILQLKSDEMQTVQISDTRFVTQLKSYLSDTKQLSWYDKLINSSFKIHLTIAFAILGLIILTYIYIIPWVGEKSVYLLPDSFDKEIGNTAFAEAMLTEHVESKKTALLEDFTKELKLRKDKPLHFTIVDSDILNAFALPDGNIVIYTGILDKMKSYEELIALIGHESAHVYNRHSMKLMCRDLSGYIFISTILGDVNGVMAVIGEHANSLQSLSYSRNFEKEADEQGLAFMITNKANPKGITDLFSRLQEEEKEMDISIPEFLSSHPVTKERIKNMKTLISKSNIEYEKNEKLIRIFQNLKKD